MGHPIRTYGRGVNGSTTELLFEVFDEGVK
jgi:hypothetical protein